jgi:hypothetical protein
MENSKNKLVYELCDRSFDQNKTRSVPCRIPRYPEANCECSQQEDSRYYRCIQRNRTIFRLSHDPIRLASFRDSSQDSG